jgi:Tol biopolymer transport system component
VRKINNILFLVSSFLFFSITVNAQFGKNKVQYERFDFKVLQTQHWDIYNYLEDSNNIHNFGIWAEQWYQRHQLVFDDHFNVPSPLILHNNHADFQQTTVIEGMMGTSTSGVTEGFRNRVVMPYLQSNKETNHVLGHEMVHVFQYRMFKSDDSLGLGALMYVPLWMIEGLAEYLSIGRLDAHSAMWMRDAIQHSDVPSIDDMTHTPHKYFPYRYGHSLWCYITGLYGDGIIKPLLKNTGKYGYDKGIEITLGINKDSLALAWNRALSLEYKPILDSTYNEAYGELIFDSKNAGHLNISPTISPNNEKLIFLSDKEVISLDIFLANPDKKKVIKRLGSSVSKEYVDEFKFLGSVGSWAPDNRTYAFTTFIKGQNRLLIIDTKKRKVIHKIKIKNLDAFKNPEWSPDGKKIILSGLVNGQTDIYEYHLKQDSVSQLTNDAFSDMQVEYSPDGKKIVFISDRGPDTDLGSLSYGSYRLCEMDLATKVVNVYNIFPKANIVDPHYTPDGKKIIFLSNLNGMRNLYEFDLTSYKTWQLTNFYTGISGLTELSPATCISDSNMVYYTFYKNNSYTLYKTSLKDFDRKEVDPLKIDFTAAILPPLQQHPKEFVSQNIRKDLLKEKVSFKEKPYKRKFRLEFVGSTGGAGIGGGMGAGIGQFDAGMYGSVQLFFGDILKRNQIYSALQVNGEFKDIGGTVFYLNKERRLNWGGGISHIPLRGYYFDSYNYDQYTVQYIFLDQAGTFAYFPINKKMRFEIGQSITNFSYRTDSIYNDGTGYKEVKIDSRDPFFYTESYLAFVGDDASYGFTGPMQGYRYRFEVEKYFGEYNYYGVVMDYRKYFYLSPSSFAFRAQHYGKYGDYEGWFYNYYLWQDFYFIKGYNKIYNENLFRSNASGIKFIMINAEYRLPFTGHERLSLLKSRMFYSDLVFFFEGAVAWNKKTIWNEASDVKLRWEPKPNKRTPIFSTGVSLRINMFGMLILEPYYAFPFQSGINRPVFGLTFSSGGW